MSYVFFEYGPIGFLVYPVWDVLDFPYIEVGGCNGVVGGAS